MHNLFKYSTLVLPLQILVIHLSNFLTVGFPKPDMNCIY